MAGAARKERPQVGHAASSGPRNVAQEGHFGGVESASGRSASRLRVWHPSQRTWAGLVAWHSGHSPTRARSSRPRRAAADLLRPEEPGPEGHPEGGVVGIVSQAEGERVRRAPEVPPAGPEDPEVEEGDLRARVDLEGGLEAFPGPPGGGR